MINPDNIADSRVFLYVYYLAEFLHIDYMVVWFTITYAINDYNHYSCEFESRLWLGVLDTTLCDNVCQWLTAGRYSYYIVEIAV